ncbi:hypothetical protein KDA_07050 [Dictyobacter alpinus]|uniref:Uncharacterized protein n=1 Tax=Dictyobacter alpinus TaxID=2014873 RepID=A0A402B1J4_9CHLR|nr:hypothetical protein KDA_07050 [Dictyobacter alpinus]
MQEAACTLPEIAGMQEAACTLPEIAGMQGTASPLTGGSGAVPPNLSSPHPARVAGAPPIKRSLTKPKRL